MPIDLEALNKQIGGVLPGPKTERSNVYIPTKEEQNKSGYNTHYSFEDTTEDLKNKIASQQGFGDWISKVPLTFGAAVASGAAATGGVGLEVLKMGGAALWTPLENFDSYMSGSNKWHSFASNYDVGNPLIDFAEGIKQMTKDWQLNYADNRTFMGKLEAFTESAINSFGEYGAIGGITAIGATASLAKLGIKGMAKNYTVGAIGSYVGGAHEGVVNAREDFDRNYQDANMMLNQKYQKKTESLQSALSHGEIDENTYNLKLQEIDKTYKEEQEYIHDVLTQSSLSTIAFNTAAIGTMNLMEFNLFGNSYNLMHAGIRKLKGTSKLYDDILSPALGKNLDEISHQDLLDIEAKKVMASKWTGLKNWGLDANAEGFEEITSDSIKILSEGYAQDKLNEKKLAKNYNGQNYLDKWMNYMSSPEMLETYIGGAYAGGLTQGATRIVGKLSGKDSREQQELQDYASELLSVQKPIRQTLEHITKQGAAIDKATEYLEKKDYAKYNASISQLFNDNIIRSIEKGTFNVNKGLFANQEKENNEKISKLQSENLTEATPEIKTKRSEEIESLKLHNENIKAGIKIMENYESAYQHYEKKYASKQIAEIVLGKDIEIEFAKNYLKQMDLTRTVEESESFRIRDLALNLNGRVMDDRVAKAISLNDYYKAIAETSKAIQKDFELLGEDATEQDLLDLTTELKELREFTTIATNHFIQKEVFENAIKDNIAFKNKIDQDVDFRLKLTDEAMNSEKRKEIEAELEDSYYANRRIQLRDEMLKKLKKEGLSQNEYLEIEQTLKKELVNDELIDNYIKRNIDIQSASTEESDVKKEEKTVPTKKIIPNDEIEDQSTMTDGSEYDIFTYENSQIANSIENLSASEILNNPEIVDFILDTMNIEEKDIADKILEIKEKAKKFIKDYTDLLARKAKNTKTQTQKNITNEDIANSIKIRDEIFNHFFKTKDSLKHLFNFSAKTKEEIVDIHDKIALILSELKGSFENNPDLLSADKQLILNKINFEIFYNFAQISDKLPTIFPLFQQYKDLVQSEELTDEQVDEAIAESEVLSVISDVYTGTDQEKVSLGLSLVYAKESIDDKKTKKEIEEDVTIIDDDDENITIIPEFAKDILAFLDALLNLENEDSDVTAVVELINNDNEFYDSISILASIDPDNKIFVEKQLDRELGELHKFDVNTTLTSSTLEYDHSTDTVIGIRKINNQVPETTKKILSGEYNGKEFVLKIESDLEIKERTEQDQSEKINEHELEKLKLMIDRLKRIYTGVEFEFATESELYTKLPQDKKHLSKSFKAVYFPGEGKIVFNTSHKNLSYETAIHEIAHPLIRLIKKQNSKLYNELLSFSKVMIKGNESISSFVLNNYFNGRSEQSLNEAEKWEFEQECLAHALEIAGAESIIYQERLDKKTNNKKMLIIQKFRSKFEEIIKFLIKKVMNSFFKKSSILKNKEGEAAIFSGIMTNKQIEIKMSDINYDMSLGFFADLMLSLKVKIDLSSISQESSKEEVIISSMEKEIKKIQKNKQKDC